LLLMLERGKSHGYDLKDALDPFGLGDVNPSLVYRSLRDMEDEGLVESEWDTETSAGPARRVYEITADGQAHLQQWARDLRETDRILHHFLKAVDNVADDEETLAGE
jgi:DNA-binding PadR family transcriptional regulator